MDGEITISTQLTREQYRLLCLLAELRHCRRADVIQQALAAYLQSNAAAELRALVAELRVSSSTNGSSK